MKSLMFKMGIWLLILAGMALLLYPNISNWLAEKNQSKAIEQYSVDVTEMTARVIEEEWKKAGEYNDALSGVVIKDPFIPGSGAILPENYNSVLNLNGIMGYIEIPKISVSLPIYHGTSETVLIKGVGHMDQTAFPIGGEGNHTVLTGHTALSSAKLFTHLDQLVTGDVFYLHILDKTLAYEVNQIIVVEPQDTSALIPVAGEDYVTLVTCTPYAINSHRLFVRGTHISYTKEEQEEGVSLTANPVNWRIMIIIVFVVLWVLAFGIYKYVVKYKKGKGSGR